MNRNLTVGDPGKVLIYFTVPLFVSVIFQQMYNIADSVIAGKYAGEDALAAVGASYPITMIFMAIAFGCQIGCSIIVSKYMGKGDICKVKTCIFTSLIAGLIISSFISIVGVIFSGQLMELVNTPSNIFGNGNLYLRVFNGGFIFLFIYNITTGIFNSLGDSKTPLYLLICSSLGNIGLDALFVIVFKMGVGGVALATFIAQGIACISSVLVLLRRIKTMKTTKKYKLVSMEALKEIVVVAIPSILQQSFVSVGNMFIQYLVNGYGSSVIAGYSAAIKLNTFAITSFATLGNGVSSFTAQNMGAEKYDRIKKGFKSGIIFALAVAFAFFVMFFFFCKPFLMLFINEKATPTVMETGKSFLRITSVFYFTVCTKLICDAVLRGSECMNYFMATTFTDLFFRVVLAFIFAGIWGVVGIWAAWPVSWVAASVLSVVFYQSNVWLKDKKPLKNDFELDIIEEL